VAAGVAKAAKRVAAKEAEAAEAMARVAAQQEAAETIAREKAARRASGHDDMPPPELQDYHRLIIHVEHCMAQRPSPMGSLQGAAERYASSFQHFQEAVLSHEMCGAIPSASPEVVIVANNLGYRPPGSEENTTASGEPGWPRLGSFEVSVTLYDTRTGQRWGPITLFSKIASYKFPAIVKLTGRVHGQLIEWLGLPPPRNPRPQSAQARTPGIRPGHGGRDRFANDGGSPGHGGLGFRGSEGALLTATTMVSELQRVNETLHEEHTALQQHVGSLEGEMAAMRADLQALRVDMSRGGDDRILGKIGNKVGGLTRASTNDEPAGKVTVRVCARPAS